MRPRIIVNLAVFGALSLLMAVWAVSSLLPVRIGEKTFTVRAEFLSSPGLRADLEVDYLGVRIGRVEDVTLRTGRVDVVLEIDHGVAVPGNATAVVLRKSAVGEPYVELSPPEDEKAAGELSGGDVIPLRNTSVAVEYQRLFDSAEELLGAVKPADVRTLTHELAVGLEGQGQNLRDTLADLDRLTGTLADNAGVLDALAVQLTQLTGTLADKRTRLAGGLDSLAAFTGTLSGSRAELTAILEETPDFLDQVNALLDESTPGFRCLLTALGTPHAPVFTDKASGELTHLLNRLHKDFPPLADAILVRRPEGMYAKVKLVFTAAGPIPNAQEYDRELTDPKEPPLYYCRTGQDAKAPAPAPPAGTPSGKPAAQAEPQPFRTVDPRTAGAAEQDDSGLWPPLIPIVVSALVLLGVAVHSARRLRGPRPERPTRRRE